MCETLKQVLKDDLLRGGQKGLYIFTLGIYANNKQSVLYPVLPYFNR